jgi:hypothetical protein
LIEKGKLVVSSILHCVDFSDKDGTPIPGLVPVNRKYGKNLTIDEYATVLEAETFEHIDYVFFRRFSDGRSSQIAAYVVDNSDEKLDNDTLANLHRQVWLQGKAPLIYIAWPSRVDVLACAREPDFWDDVKKDCRYQPIKELELKTATEINLELQRFSAFRLADGTFWDDNKNRKLANHDKAAHQSLIQAVVDTDRELEGEKKPLLRRLLLLMVLIKYLEDREVFPNDVWFGKFHKGARNFFDVLEGGNPNEVHRLLNFLANKFNGDVFDLSDFKGEVLSEEVLKNFAMLVGKRTIKKQLYLWEQFSFEHLPVEVISHLYQHFVVDGHGAVYTPPFLAELLLDHSMPYSKSLTGKERILDPACGSGVFLVGAFRRLINIWRSNHDWKKPDVETLKTILRERIFGVDLDRNAVDLAAFSLSLALCDALRPEVIWEELKFARLRDANLFEKDFFQLLLETRQGAPTILSQSFDVVIGNPPFESKLTPAGNEINNLQEQKASSRGQLPDKQIAHLFLEQGLSILRPKTGRICLIQPSGFLYNRNVNTFRTYLLNKYQFKTVFDFTSIRNLYEADPKTIAIFACADDPQENHWIAHWTFRRTVSVQERICFELDHYDRHRISQRQAEEDFYVWRANLLGGGRLSDMSQRIRSLRTLAEYIKQQEDWDYGEGFIVAKTGKRDPAPFLTGKPLLPTGAFTNSGIDVTKLAKVTETEFRSPYTETRYSAPLILIKQSDTLPIAFWDEGPLAYRDKIVGIHAPKTPQNKLRTLYNTLHNRHDLYRFCCALNGTQSLVGKATAILKQDIDLLPYPENPNDLALSYWEDILCEDTLNYMTKYVRLGQDAPLLKKSADSKDLCEYATVFIKMLGSVYTNLKSNDPIYLNGLICQPFYFGEKPELSWLENNPEIQLHDLVYHQNHEHLRTVRIFRYYSENVLLIVKPDRLRYWIRSTAIRDADETLEDLHRWGY